MFPNFMIGLLFVFTFMCMQQGSSNVCPNPITSKMCRMIIRNKNKSPNFIKAVF